METGRQRELLDGLRREQEKLSHKRRELFGERNPHDEETRLSMAIEIAEKNLETARQKHHATLQELGSLKSKIR